MKYTFETPDVILLNNKAGTATLPNCADVEYEFSSSYAYVTISIDSMSFKYEDIDDLGELLTALRTQLLKGK